MGRAGSCGWHRAVGSSRAGGAESTQRGRGGAAETECCVFWFSGTELTCGRHGRWEDLDDSPVTWHIVGDIAGMAADNGASYDPFNTEPWQLAVNGIY